MLRQVVLSSLFGSLLYIPVAHGECVFSDLDSCKVRSMLDFITVYHHVKSCGLIISYESFTLLHLFLNLPPLKYRKEVHQLASVHVCQNVVRRTMS